MTAAGCSIEFRPADHVPEACFYGLCFSMKYSFKHINLISKDNSFNPSLCSRARCNVCHELAFSIFSREI